MDNYSKYDGILGGIGITVVLMLAGILVAPYMTMGAGVVGILLMGIALFAIPPVTEKTPHDRKI